MQMGRGRETVVGVFHDEDDARAALSALRDAGFTEEHLGVLAHDRKKGVVDVKDDGDRGSKACKGAAIGAATGVGGGALWALGIAAGVLPAIGPVIAGGLLAAVAASAAAGAAAGGIVGALIGLGIPEEEARYYEGELKQGRTLVTVKATGRVDEAFAIMQRYNAYDMHSRTAVESHPTV
jgi:hypothetical protein